MNLIRGWLNEGSEFDYFFLLEIFFEQMREIENIPLERKYAEVARWLQYHFLLWQPCKVEDH